MPILGRGTVQYNPSPYTGAKLSIQEYDFNIERITGKDNFIADSFSRFCHFPNKEDESNDDCDMSEYVMGMLDDFDIPRDKLHLRGASTPDRNFCRVVSCVVVVHKPVRA